MLKYLCYPIVFSLGIFSWVKYKLQGKLPNQIKAPKPKAVFITGGSKGIGKALLLHYAEYVPSVKTIIITGRNASELESAKQEAEIVAMRSKKNDFHVVTHSCDVRDRDAMEHIVQTMDEQYSIDLVIANAGVAKQQILNQDPKASFSKIARTIYDINWNGMLNTVLPIVDRYIERPNKVSNPKQIVLVSSGNAHLPGMAEDYGISKHAISTYAFSLRAKLASHNIAVNCIEPGPVNTDMLNSISKEGYTGTKTEPSKAAEYYVRQLTHNRGLIQYPTPFVVQLLYAMDMLPLVFQTSCILHLQEQYEKALSKTLG